MASIQELRIDESALRTREQLQDEVTRNFLLLIEFVVNKTGPVKTYAQAARMISMEPGNLTKIQQGLRTLPYEAAIRACDVFGCSYNYMFRSEGEMFGKDEVMRQLLKLQARMEAVEKKLGLSKKGNNG